MIKRGKGCFAVRNTGKNLFFREIPEHTIETTFEPKFIKKTRYEEVKMTMVDFNNKVLND